MCHTFTVLRSRKWSMHNYCPVFANHHANPMKAGAHFTNNFSITFQMWWKFHFALIQILIKWSLQYLAHATTAGLSWHVPNVVAIWSSVVEWNFHHIWIVMEKSLVKWVPVRLSVDARKWPIGLAIMSHKHQINLPIALETRSWHCNVYKSKSIDTFDGRHRHLMVDTITNDVHVNVCFVYSYAFHVSYYIRV